MTTRTPASRAARERPDTQVRIGARLRAARQARSLTIAQVAESAGLTKGFVSRLERDDVSPSVASLVTVCEVLGLRVGDLFDPPETAVIRAGEGRPINFGGTGAHEALITPGTQQGLEIIHARIDAGGNGGDDLYTLDCDVECAYVIAGHLTIVLETGEEDLGPGDAMTFPGRAPHTWRNASVEAPCEVLWVLAPAP
ncbi:helix-turn-helix domain-containing protein [Pedococcus aerophilus]|uniref:Helix-turn-helix domain-containing protein n=1 Tax=Pedococcus aerophilus TaxID=436356 RepID=A0ABN3UTA0_9MICO